MSAEFYQAWVLSAEFSSAAPRYDDYISFMKDKYRKEVLTPLRRRTETVESFIGSQNWEEINYNRTWSCFATSDGS